MKKVMFFFGGLLWATLSLSQVNDLTYSGRLVDAFSGDPIAGATILLESQGIGYEAISDEIGSFRFQNLIAGFYQISFTSMGYQAKRVVEIDINTGVPRNQTFTMKPSAASLGEVIVKAESRSRSNEAVSSIHTMTVEETFRYPGTFYDPARLATAYAGVIGANDQANNLVIRGNNPNGMGWFLQGVEIVNPNHLSNAGTFNDRPTQSGGGVNILSAQMLDNSTFLTGAFPANYGNVTAGILDMQLRQGATDDNHFTGQIGLTGIDLASEGPLDASKKNSYLVNYRYSTLGILSAMGVDLGDEAINFQDLSFHLDFQTAKGGSISFFGLGGVSTNRFSGEDIEERDEQKDYRNIDFDNRMGAIGIKYQDSKWEHALVYSGRKSSRDLKPISDLVFALDPSTYDEIIEERIGIHSRRSMPLSKGQLSVGVRANQISYDYSSSRPHNTGPYSTSASEGGFLLQVYGSLVQDLSPRTILLAGLHGTNFSLNKAFAAEPRVALKHELNHSSSLNLSYGLHSRIVEPNVMLSSSIVTGKSNIDLDFMRAHHLVLGHEQQLGVTSKLTTEIYYQSLYNLPVAPGDDRSLSTINYIDYVGEERLVSGGTGTNTGLEITFQKYFSGSTYFVLNGTVYDSKYVGGDGIKRNTRYNGKYGINLTGGKEFSWNKGHKIKVVGLNLKVTSFGGFWEQPIDVVASAGSFVTRFDEAAGYSQQLPALFRSDFRVYFKRIKEKYTSILGLDLLNATNHQNISYHYYDGMLEKVVPNYQLGLIPNLSYRIEF